MNLRLTTMTAAVALMFFTPIASYPQDSPPAPPGTVAPSAVDTKSDTYTQQKLDQILAPIALYPDQLVTQILMASTFPLEIVEAARWLDNPSNAALQGDALVTALQPMNWDPSIKSITAFPAIVAMLNQNLDWTNSLGVAFTHQQSDVMAQIQFLRHQAQKAGNLASNDKIVCRDEGPNIVIGPANPNVIYAPHYNPAVVYGAWPWAEYPPVYFSPGYFGLGPLGVGVGWAWGAAWPIVPAFWGWYGVNWGMSGSIFVDGGGYSRIAYGNATWGGGNWQHPGGGVSHGGFGGGVGAGSSQQGASHASLGQLGFDRASAQGAPHASGGHGGGGHPGGGGGRQGAAHASGGHGGGSHPGGGGGHQGTAHASAGHGGGGRQGNGGGHQGAAHASGGQGGGGHQGGGGGHQGAAHASGGHGGGGHHG
jgi:hypothetical protein